MSFDGQERANIVEIRTPRTARPTKGVGQDASPSGMVLLTG